jgi:pimeloyl-ACP methyl ester carboxylesterase
MKITLNNSITNYSEHGKPQGLPVAFIHGFPFNHEMWKPQLAALPNDVRIILYDVRGHGASDVGDGQFTIELFVEDLIALLDHLVIKKVVLCGLSMGGYIALRAFEKYPGRISGLILCDTKSESDTNDAKIKRAVTMKAIKESDADTFAENFVRSIFWEKTFDKNPDIIEAAKQMIRKNSPIGICGTLLALASRTDTTQVLTSINVPTCIIAGEYDKLAPPSSAQAMHKTIVGSELHILSNAGHMSNLENSKKFNEILIAFLNKYWHTKMGNQ